MRKGKNVDINELLNNPTPEDIDALAASNINITMNKSLIEKLSESVIDSAGLRDEEEVARREAYRKAEKQRKIRNICICAISVIAIIGILIIVGYTLRKSVDTTSYNSILARHETLPRDDESYALSIFAADELQLLIDKSKSLAFDESELDEKMLENTLLKNYYAFCNDNDLVYDDYLVIDAEEYSLKGTIYYVYYTKFSVFNKQIEDNKIYYDTLIIVEDEEDFEKISAEY